MRPYGAQKHDHDAVPGLRYAPAWAIFVSSSEDGDYSFDSETKGTVSATNNIHAIGLSLRIKSDLGSLQFVAVIDVHCLPGGEEVDGALPSRVPLPVVVDATNGKGLRADVGALMYVDAGLEVRWR